MLNGVPCTSLPVGDTPFPNPPPPPFPPTPGCQPLGVGVLVGGLVLGPIIF